MSTQSIVGDAGDDTLTGTTDSEQFTGGKGSDTVIYGMGGGQDTLLATYDTASDKIDTLQLNGIALDTLRFSRDGNDLLIDFNDQPTDSIAVKMFFYGDDPGNAFNPLQRITFKDDHGKTPQPVIAPLAIADILTKLTTGGSGDDDLRGTALADTLIGGAGNDTVTGGKGNDDYQFNRGDGQDVIASAYDTNSARNDTLKIGTGLTSDDLSFSSTGSGGTSLLIRFGNSTDQLTVENFLADDKTANNYSPLQRITFADGDTEMKAVDILEALYRGTAGADNQHGTSGNDSITGLAGNDLIDARAGNDTLVGGLGDDTLNGGAGSDDYYYARGDGNDLIKLQSDTSSGRINTLHLATGIAVDDISLTRSGTSLVVGIKGSGTVPASTITVEYFSFTAGSDSNFNPLQQIVFDGVQATGTDGKPLTDTSGNALPVAWNLATMQSKLAGSTGSGASATTGADLLIGTTGADTLTGGAGNDTLDGGKGNDTYVFTPGDGQDTIVAAFDSSSAELDNTLQLNNIVSTDLRLSREGNDLVIGFKDKAGDRITAKLFFLGDDPGNDYSPLQTITFKQADGTAQAQASFSTADILELMSTGSTGNDRLRGTSGDDTLIGRAGDDTLIGGNGDDVIEFTIGDGNDLITALAPDARTGKNDTLMIHGLAGTSITADSLTLGTAGTSLVVRTGGSGGQITVENFLYQDDPYNDYNPLQTIVFDDGTDLDITTILKKLYGGSTGADTLRGTGAADTITGLAGNDTLDGRDGNDRIEGGAGNDLIDGGKGSDDYWFGLGDGQDTLQAAYDSTSRTNALMLESGIVAEDLKLTRSGANLVISFNGRNTANTDTITVKSFSFALNSDTSYNPLQAIMFDGVTVQDSSGNDLKLSWNLADIQAAIGGSGGSAASLTGTDQADTIKGTTGNDRITGHGGDDTIDGGLGNDTFVFAQGDGSDVLSLSRDASADRNDQLELAYLRSDQATFTRSGNDLVIGTPVAGDQITARGFYLLNDPSNSYNPLQSIAFLDGTQDRAWIVERANIGTIGDDKLVGTSGADTLEGGKGSDTLSGGQGDDIYTFNVGDGRDTIMAVSSDSTVNRVDTLNLVGTDLSVDDLVLETSGTSLIISLVGNNTDQITVTRFLEGDNPSNKYNPLQAISFNGNTTALDIKGILAKLHAGTTGADSLRGTLDADSISGGYGNDTLDGRAGNDTLSGGRGNDSITGGTGDNTYQFTEGDGQDTLAGYRDVSQGKSNTLELHGYSTDDVVINQLKSSLIITFDKVDKNNTDMITVNNFDFTGAGNDYNPLQNIRFADSGTTWSGTGAILDHFTGMTVQGGSTDERLSGSWGDDTLIGAGGDDTLIGGRGDDELTGGTGDDLITGGDGDDTFSFDLGDGNDTLVGTPDSNTAVNNTLAFGTGVVSGDLALTRMGTSLVIYLDKADTGNTDQITVEDFSFSADDGSTSSPLQTLTVGGATWDLATIQGKVSGLTRAGDSDDNTLYGADLKDTLTGGAGDDMLYGLGGNDALTGGAGDDRLNGGEGNDGYTYKFGDGNDTLAGSPDSNTAVNNTLYLVDLVSRNVQLTQRGTSLVIYVPGEGARDDSEITVENFSFEAGDGNTSNPLQTIAFRDDYPDRDWDLATIRAAVGAFDLDGHQSADLLSGGDRADTLYGADGDDTLVGHDGNDDLTGAKGHDSLIGGDGDDTYHFSPGDEGDTIVDSGGKDTLSIATWNSGLIFKQDGDDLEIHAYGSSASSTAEIIRIDDWYLGTDHQVESIVANASFGGTRTLSSTNVASLVAAMASFDLPATAGELTTTDGFDDVLTAIGQYWKS
jgi:Ca2+-binding RTX toxin-like protein